MKICSLSLIAGACVVFLPETRDAPLPETLHDAVVFLQPRHNSAEAKACLGLRQLIGKRDAADGQDSWTDSCDNVTAQPSVPANNSKVSHEPAVVA